MSLFVTDQVMTFFLTVILGGLLALCYDVLRILRRLVHHKNWVINMEDFFYFVLSGCFIFYILFHKNYGEIRVFSLIGALIGIILYYATISPFIVSVGTGVLTWIAKLLLRIIKIVITPVILLIKLVLIPIQFILKIVKAFISRHLTKGKKWVKIKGKKAKKRLGALRKRRRVQDEEGKKPEKNYW